MIQLTQVPQTDEDLFGPEQQIEERTEEFVVLRLGAEWYALRVGEVREVVRVERVTRI
jgi:chemotaxis signal transduction protein